MARQQPDQAAGRHDDHGGTETEVFPSANDSQLVGTPQHRAASVLSVSVMLHRARHRQHPVQHRWRRLFGEAPKPPSEFGHRTITAAPHECPPDSHHVLVRHREHHRTLNQPRHQGTRSTWPAGCRRSDSSASRTCPSCCSRRSARHSAASMRSTNNATVSRCCDSDRSTWPRRAARAALWLAWRASMTWIGTDIGTDSRTPWRGWRGPWKGTGAVGCTVVTGTGAADTGAAPATALTIRSPRLFTIVGMVPRAIRFWMACLEHPSRRAASEDETQKPSSLSTAILPHPCTGTHCGCWQPPLTPRRLPVKGSE